MTLEEAQKIARIVAMADGGCSVCVTDLVYTLNKEFKEFNFTMNENFYKVSEDERVTVTRS